MYLTLGFDAKTVKVDSWDESRKNIFLLNKKCKFPKSVDDSVWSSIFDNKNSRQTNTIFQGYHVKLSELEQACIGICKTIVCVALELESCSDNDLLKWRSRLDEQQSELLMSDRVDIPSICNPSVIPSEFKFIGYDVADFWCLSGLMNCGVEADNNLSKKFTSFLNDHHLFEDFSKANEYALYFNDVVKEHAPFFVYSLWVKS